MGKVIIARCLLCGKTYELGEEHNEFKKLSDQGKEVPTFICELCGYRVRHESDEKNRPQKPI